MKELVVGLIAIAIMVLSALWSARGKRRRDEAWQQFAASRQLGWSRGQIAGVASGFTVAMLTETRGSGRNRREVAVVRCSLGGALPEEFSLERETMADKLLQLVGQADHQLGYPEMDAAFFIKNLGTAARSVLTHRNAQEALLSTVQAYPQMRIGNGVVQLEAASMPDTEASLSRLLADAVFVASALQRAKQRS